jgi:hypothetical protein
MIYNNKSECASFQNAKIMDFVKDQSESFSKTSQNYSWFFVNDSNIVIVLQNDNFLSVLLLTYIYFSFISLACKLLMVKR